MERSAYGDNVWTHMQLQSSTEPRQRKKIEKIEKMPLHHRHSTIYFCIQVAKNLHATQCAVIHVFWTEMREDIYTNWCNWIRSTSRTSGECSSGRVRLVCVSLPSFCLLCVCLSVCGSLVPSFSVLRFGTVLIQTALISRPAVRCQSIHLDEPASIIILSMWLSVADFRSE